ncbi:MAG: hypothetical protein ACLP9L_05725 [Thermoguttaceae bacterium]
MNKPRSFSLKGDQYRMNWARFGHVADRWIPIPKVLNLYPNQRFYAKHSK